MERVQHRLNEARNPNVSVWRCNHPRSSSSAFPLNATDKNENLREKSGEVCRPASNTTPAGTRVMPIWRNPGHGCVRRSGSRLRAPVSRRAEIRDSGPTRMTRGKPSWLGFKPAPRMHPSSRHPLLRIVARSLALQPGIGFRIVSKLFLALGSLLRATRNVANSWRSSSSLSLPLSLYFSFGLPVRAVVESAE